MALANGLRERVGLAVAAWDALGSELIRSALCTRADTRPRGVGGRLTAQGNRHSDLVCSSLEKLGLLPRFGLRSMLAP